MLVSLRTEKMIKGLDIAEALALCVIPGVSGLVESPELLPGAGLPDRLHRVPEEEEPDQRKYEDPPYPVHCVLLPPSVVFGASFAAAGAPPASLRLAKASERRL